MLAIMLFHDAGWLPKGISIPLSNAAVYVHTFRGLQGMSISLLGWTLCNHFATVARFSGMTDVRTRSVGRRRRASLLSRIREGRHANYASNSTPEQT